MRNHQPSWIFLHILAESSCFIKLNIAGDRTCWDDSSCLSTIPATSGWGHHNSSSIVGYHNQKQLSFTTIRKHHHKQSTIPMKHHLISAIQIHVCHPSLTHIHSSFTIIHTVDGCEILHHRLGMVETCYNPTNNGSSWGVYQWTGFLPSIHSR